MEIKLKVTRLSIVSAFLVLLFSSCSEQKRQSSFRSNDALFLNLKESQILYKRCVHAENSVKRVLLLGDSIDIERGETTRNIQDTLNLFSGVLKPDEIGLYSGFLETSLSFLKENSRDTIFLKQIDTGSGNIDWKMSFSNQNVEGELHSIDEKIIDLDVIIFAKSSLRIESSEIKPVEGLSGILSDSVSLECDLIFQRRTKTTN